MTSDRLSKLKKELGKQHIDAILVSSIPNIFYLTNFYELERSTFLLITKDKNYFFGHPDFTGANDKVKGFTFVEPSAKNRLSKILSTLFKKHKIKQLGIEEDDLRVLEKDKLITNSVKLQYCSEFLNTLRAVKEKQEISAIKKACKLTDKTFSFVLKKVKLGVTEKQLVFEIEQFMRQNGAEIAFPSIVAFGKNSATPHHQPTDAKLQPNNFVLFDIGAKIDNYCADLSRTVFFGKAAPQQKKMYQTVLAAQQKAIDALRPSMKAKDVDKIAREHIAKQGFPSIPHFLGHGVGIEVHDGSPIFYPSSKDILEKSMVFAIEPGIYDKKLGGVRIEDTLYLQKNEAESLTRSPKHLIEI